MESETAKKLRILKSINKISEADIVFLNHLDQLLTERQINGSHEMLLIHLATTIDRSTRNDGIDPMPDELWQQVQTNPQYTEAKQLLDQEISNYSKRYVFSKEEQKFIILHLSNLLGGEKV